MKAVFSRFGRELFHLFLKLWTHYYQDEELFVINLPDGIMNNYCASSLLV